MTGAISNLLLTLISDWSNPVMAVFNLKPLSVTSDLGGCGGCGGNVWVTVTGDSHCDLIRPIKSPYLVTVKARFLDQPQGEVHHVES